VILATRSARPPNHLCVDGASGSGRDQRTCPGLQSPVVDAAGAEVPPGPRPRAAVLGHFADEQRRIPGRPQGGPPSMSGPMRVRRPKEIDLHPCRHATPPGGWLEGEEEHQGCGRSELACSASETMPLCAVEHEHVLKAGVASPACVVVAPFLS